MKWIALFFVMLTLSAAGQVRDDLVDRSNPPCADTLAYTDVPMRTCDMTLLVGGATVFNTHEELRDRIALFKPVCDTALISPIDFDRFTLIGCWIHLGNCPAGQRFSVHVCRDDSARVYRHIVYMADNPCRGMSSYMSWILVPKLPPGYRVVFEGGRH